MVLGNNEDHYWEKNDKYSPFLSYYSVHQLTRVSIDNQHYLCQGDRKHAFWDTNLLEKETTIIKPPIGFPFNHPDELRLPKKTLYRLKHSQHHRFDRISSTLRDMGLKKCPHNPCFYTGTLTSRMGGVLHRSICKQRFYFIKFNKL